METSISKLMTKHVGEILSLNLDNLDVVDLARRLEMAVAVAGDPICIINHECNCPSRVSCGTFCV